MAKVAFNHNIEEDLCNTFARLYEVLPGHKYEVLEAALRAFIALPSDLQDKLISGRPENREVVLAALAALQMPAVTKKSGQRKRSAGA